MDEMLAVDSVLPPATGAGTAKAAAPPPRRRRLNWALALFGLACAATGLFAALIVVLVFQPTLGQPVGLLVAVFLACWAIVSVSLYRLAGMRRCDRAIVMGGGLVSTVMCSMMFLD